MTKKQLKNKLWKLVSRYVRETEKTCYTCNRYLEFRSRSAGHYWTQGGHKRTIYDLMNVHTQCLTCNSFKSGNLAKYSSRLLQDYGLKKYQELERKANDSTPYSTLELEEMISKMELLFNKISL